MLMIATTTYSNLTMLAKGCEIRSHMIGMQLVYCQALRGVLSSMADNFVTYTSYCIKVYFII